MAFGYGYYIIGVVTTLVGVVIPRIPHVPHTEDGDQIAFVKEAKKKGP
jgi:hypothetical protein